MTAEEFRKMALSLPETSEAAHMGHPDFRVGGKIFATLSPPGQGWAMVKLTPDQQESFVQAEPKVFAPFNGAWGRDGTTGPFRSSSRPSSWTMRATRPFGMATRP